MENWKEKRIDFYQNSKSLEFIKNYFDVKKGIRLVACHNKNGETIRNINDYQTLQLRPLTLPDYTTGKYNILKDFWCVHSLMYTFDNKMADWMKIKDHTITLENNRVGINAVIDLDTPDDPESDKAKRLTFFDHIQQFNNTINIIDKKLDEECQDYNLMFSGNGIYFILNGYYGDNLLTYRDNFVNTIDNLKENGLDDKLKVHIDNKSAAWSVYTKIPFTFHTSKDRISIPLPKGEIDGRWLNEVSNSNNIMNDYTIVNEIIKKSNWNKIW